MKTLKCEFCSYENSDNLRELNVVGHMIYYECLECKRLNYFSFKRINILKRIIKNENGELFLEN